MSYDRLGHRRHAGAGGPTLGAASDNVAEVGTPPDEEFEITSAMMKAGEQAIQERVGGSDLGGYFSAQQLAVEVYQAMSFAARPLERR